VKRQMKVPTPLYEVAKGKGAHSNVLMDRYTSPISGAIRSDVSRGVRRCGPLVASLRARPC